MPGKTPLEAVNKFLDTLELAASCFEPTKITVSHDAKTVVGVRHSLVSVIPLTADLPSGRDPWTLRLALQYEILDRPDKSRSERYKVSTRRYQHHVLGRENYEIMLFHWHPAVGQPWAHLHIPAPDHAPHTAKHHIPTGRITVEALMRFLVAEMHVTPNRPDWRDVLDKCENDFRRFATWGARAPNA